jgi:hypothetical protein
MEELQYFKEVERILVDHRAFGDADYIHSQGDLRYERRLDELSVHLPVAGAVRDALGEVDATVPHRVLGDTVVRYSINSALRQFAGVPRHSIPLDDCEEVLRATVNWLEVGGSSPGCRPFGAGRAVSLGGAPYNGRVWFGERDGDVFTRVFRQVVKERLAHKCQPGAELAAANDKDLALLAKGTSLLNELAPDLARSALSHVDMIAFFPLVPWNGAASMSQFGLSGTVFLSQDLLQSPWWTAEHLLHEALHQKLYDFRHGHSLLSPDFAREEAPRVCSPWNVPGADKLNCWDTHRAVAAFHVYVHLALLSAIAEERAPEFEPTHGPLRVRPGMTSSHKAMERAHYLGEQLKISCHGELGLAGKQLIDWLIEVLDALDPAPPPTGAYVHLLLDRYRGEARAVQTNMERATSCSSGLISKMTMLATREMERTRSILVQVNAGAEIERFQSAADQYAAEELPIRFVHLRNLISKTILAVSPDGYGLRSGTAESARAEEMVTQMIEDSSEILHDLFARQTV